MSPVEIFGATNQVDEKSHQAQMCLAALGDQIAESSCQQRPRHLRESEQKQRSATKSVNGPDRRPGKDEVDKTKSPRCEEGFCDRCASLFKHRRTVEGDNVN